MYDIKLEEMAHDCSPPPVTMKTSTLRLEVKRDSLTINIPTIPQMVGVAAKGNKISAKTTKVQATIVGGLDGRYTIAGRLTDDGALDLVLVAEYSVQGKPYCTQSWHVGGTRQKRPRAPSPRRHRSAGRRATRRDRLDEYLAATRAQLHRPLQDAVHGQLVAIGEGRGIEDA